jgi:hypothetical protein
MAFNATILDAVVHISDGKVRLNYSGLLGNGETILARDD